MKIFKKNEQSLMGLDTWCCRWMGGRSCPEAESMVSLLLSSNEVFIPNSEVKDFLFQKNIHFRRYTDHISLCNCVEFLYMHINL